MTSSCRTLALVAILLVVAASTACVDRSLLPGGGTTPTGPSSTSTPPTTTPPTTPQGPSNPTTTTTDAEKELLAGTVWNSPKDVASWPVTTRITRIVMRPNSDPNPGVQLTFDAQARWPNYTPPGWDGPLQYTVWAGVKVSGRWNFSGIMQFWKERCCTGAPILGYWRDWVYDSRWGDMNNYYPNAGDEMIFFVTAGDARGVLGVTSVRERSNAVVVKLPYGDSGTYNF